MSDIEKIKKDALLVVDLFYANAYILDEIGPSGVKELAENCLALCDEVKRLKGENKSLAELLMFIAKTENPRLGNAIKVVLDELEGE